MTFAEFEARAQEIFDQIPPEYREGVDGLEVTRKTVLHPTLPEVFTLGECKTEHYPSDFGGAGEVRSLVALYYGSFLRVSRTDEDWGWEEELWETITHEVRHHLESLASEDALEVEDYVMDQNFARREGEPFDPDFYRGGAAVRPEGFEVDGDVFIERVVSGETAREDVEWEGRRLTVELPALRGDVHFLTVEELSDDRRELLLVLRRPTGFLAGLRRLLSGAPARVTASSTTPPDTAPT